jgi:hypothetical protein
MWRLVATDMKELFREDLEFGGIKFFWNMVLITM